MSQRNTGVTELDTDAMTDVEACPVREVLERISGKWSIQIILVAAEKPVRFTELERTIPGISRRMLTLTLRSLERDGLLVRTVYPTVPAKVVYSVTDSARELHDAFVTLMDWAERNRGAVTAARAAYDSAALAAAEEEEPATPLHAASSGRRGRQ
ncbi:winged helix-turn-helix transcriptional regulator [Streptomyces sp. NRRL B-3229]|uniref:winged helix-turn-helix transcriptional regulator n=1 Tax=Streptomyces sp. NRRL B-3229 TaxID=1463836 RepID=UPI0004C0B99F|nr:helix-turn-helix domain-containing protein [Streptomyces sp. NRRL B-3229]